MSVIIYLAIFMIIVGAFFLFIFLFAVKNGQFDDLESPAHKILLDDSVVDEAEKKKDESKEKYKENWITYFILNLSSIFNFIDFYNLTKK